MSRFILELKKVIAKNYGKKCKEYDPFCAVCIMWHAYSTIEEGLELGKS